MSDRTVHHAGFTIEREYDVPPTRLFAAFASPVSKRRWFVDGEGWSVDAFDMDFRVGGFERSTFRFGDGPPVANDTLYCDIVPDRRIVVTYTMTVAGAPISSSLATIEFLPEGGGTRLIYTEQDAFLGGADQSGDREAGCRELLEKLGAEIAADLSGAPA